MRHIYFLLHYEHRYYKHNFMYPLGNMEDQQTTTPSQAREEQVVYTKTGVWQGFKFGIGFALAMFAVMIVFWLVLFLIFGSVAFQQGAPMM